MADIASSGDVISDFVTKLQRCLRECNTNNALALIEDHKERSELEDLSEVIPTIVCHLNEDVRAEKPALFNCSRRILDEIARKLEAEAVLLQLIDHVGDASDDAAFLSVFDALRKVLLRLPKRRLNSLEWGLNSIELFLRKLPVPEDVDLEEEEMILLDADPAVERISSLYMSLLPCYDDLLEDASKEQAVRRERELILMKFMLQLLGKPLACLDLSWNGKAKSRGRRAAEMVIEKVFRVTPDIFWTLDRYAASSEDKLAFATFFYLVLAEGVCLSSVPKLYDRLYTFQCTLYLAVELLEHSHQLVVQNGLKLVHFILHSVNGLALPYQLLDANYHSQFCKAVTNIMIYNRTERCRKKALGAFQKYLQQFEIRGQYLIIYNLMKVVNHTGVIALLITKYKDIMLVELSKEEASAYVRGHRLHALLSLFCHLHKREESDLVELADQIIATLNLLRFLVIRDKANITQIWDRMKLLEESYFEPLKKGLTMSRAHYRLKIEEMCKADERDKEAGADVSITVAGQKLPEMPWQDKMNVLNSAMTCFDVIESLLSRVTELVKSTDARSTWLACRFSSVDAPTGQSHDEERYEEDIKDKILEASLPFVAELGWSKSAISAGAGAIGYPGVVHGMFARGGGDLVYYFQRTSNQKLLEYLKQVQQQKTEKPLSGRKIVEEAVQKRLQMIEPYLSRWPQAIAIMSLPPNVANSLAMLLTMVDDICYYAGDRSVDFNWYARRIALAGVYKATELYLIQDTSPNYEKTWKFLNNRLSELMQVNDLLNKTDISSLGSKEAITSAFITARNILGLNWNR